MDMQAMVNMIGEAGLQERKGYHLLLGDAIKALEEYEGHGFSIYPALSNPHSYRGYYTDLALVETGLSRSSDDLLEDLRAIQNKELTGWKGGEFLMGDNTPMWVSNEGTSSNKAIMSFEAGPPLDFEVKIHYVKDV